MGKGSGRRPGDGFEANHERIFGKRERQQWTPPPLPEQTQPAGAAKGGDGEHESVAKLQEQE